MSQPTLFSSPVRLCLWQYSFDVSLAALVWIVSKYTSLYSSCFLTNILYSVYLTLEVARRRAHLRRPTVIEVSDAVVWTSFVHDSLESIVMPR